MSYIKMLRWNSETSEKST